MVASVLLAACGGGGGGGGGGSADGPDDGGTGGATATGVFKDSNVHGVDYVSGSQSGTTDAAGRFTYEEGADVTFRVGGVDLGRVPAVEVLTPVELVGDGQLADTDVINIARFLLMLDSDGNPENGIAISPDVQSVAADWDQLDFGSADFDTEAEPIINDASTADGGTKSLPDPAEARAHVEGTLRCVTAGAFRGTFSGDDSGSFGFLVDAGDGSVSGVAYSEETGLIDLGGDQAVSTDTQRSFASGILETGGTFEGEFGTPDEVSGNWSSMGDAGSFSGSRIGGDIDARYRFTGEFQGDDHGLFSFDVDAEGDITGVAYSVQEDELDSLEGTLSGTSLNASTGQGSTITGTLDTASGSASGNWSSADGTFAGSFSGSGCELNPPADGNTGTDDGSTDDGSTDDGSTDDGSTDDGSTDDGGTDGGTDGGSTDGGSTDDSGDDTSQSGDLYVWSDEQITNLPDPVEICNKFGVSDDGTITRATAEWVSDGRTVKTESLPELDKSDTLTCDGLPGGIDPDMCLYTCLDETGATGPTTVDVTVENGSGDQVTYQAGPIFENSGPFNGTWEGISDEFDCAGGFVGRESGTFRITQGVNSSGQNVISVYDLSIDAFAGDLNQDETIATSSSIFSSTSYGDRAITVTEWQAELVDSTVAVGNDLIGSSTFTYDDTECEGQTMFTATRLAPE